MNCRCRREVVHERVPQLFADGVIDPAVFISDRLPLAD